MEVVSLDFWKEIHANREDVMKQWEADFGNDPNDDFNLVVEILYEDRDVAVIKQSHNGLLVKWYPHSEELVVPLAWLSELLLEAKRKLPEVYEP